MITTAVDRPALEKAVYKKIGLNFCNCKNVLRLGFECHTHFFVTGLRLALASHEIVTVGPNSGSYRPVRL